MATTLFKLKINDELDNLEMFFGDKATIADLLGVDRGQLSRWGNKTYPKDNNLSKIAGLNFVVSRLMEIFKYKESALDWLTGINLHLNNMRPIDCIKLNNYRDVFAAIDAFEEGAFA